jgi:hypothetical protein
MFTFSPKTAILATWSYLKNVFKKLKEPLAKQLTKSAFWRNILLILFISYTLFFSLYNLFGPPPLLRGEHYLTSKQVVEEFGKDADRLQKIFDGKLAYYQTKVAAFYTNITFTLVFCVLGIIILPYNSSDIPVPGFSAESIKIPIHIAYLIIPAFLCYNWLQFGFYLHHIIETRAALSILIDAQYVLYHPEISSMIDGYSIPYQYYYSVTRANDLKDTGFIDSWFLQFLPQWIPTAKLTGFDRLVPLTSMIAVAVLYGISHGLLFALPFNWIQRFQTHDLQPSLPFNKVSKFQFRYIGFYISICLLLTVIFFIGVSHWSFYYSGRNPNWLQFFILTTGILVFFIVTTAYVRNLHKGM